MNEILFRGKREHSGEWIYGDLIHLKNGKLAIRGWLPEHFPAANTVRSNSVGKYTGLTDKNGVKIFEGDIVKFISEVYEIAYIEKHARFAGKREDVALAVFPCEYAEVIGNIHDNLELLEVNEND